MKRLKKMTTAPKKGWFRGYFDRSGNGDTLLVCRVKSGGTDPDYYVDRYGRDYHLESFECWSEEFQEINLVLKTKPIPTEQELDEITFAFESAKWKEAHTKTDYDQFVDEFQETIKEIVTNAVKHG